MAIVSHYLEHQQLRKANRYSAMAIFNILDQHLEIESVLDLGCGTGVWMQAALCKPGRTVLGVDLEEFAPAELLVSEDTIINATLSQSINLHRRFDLVLCLETAEHIPGECAHHIVANCVGHSDIVLFSAALPGQGGLNHVNEQWPEYWEGLFHKHDYESVDLLRPLIWNDHGIPVWYRQNMILFVNRVAESALSRLQSEAKRTPVTPLGRAHPDLLQMHAHQWGLCKEELAKLQAALSTSEAESRRAHAELEASRAELAKLQAALSTSEAESRRAHAELKASRAEVALLKSELSHAQERSQEDKEAIRAAAALAKHFLTRAEHARSETRRIGALAESVLRQIHESTSWRLTAPARVAVAAFRGLRALPRSEGFDPSDFTKHLQEVQTSATDGSVSGAEPRDTRIKVVFVSGEPHTPGHNYRITNMVSVLPALFFHTVVITLDELGSRLADLEDAAVLWIWRAGWCQLLENAVALVRSTGAKVVFDVDDLMFLPELATATEIDGIRSQNCNEAEIAILYERIRKTMHEADFCITTTGRLAKEMARLSKVAAIIPNGFGPNAYHRAQEAVAAAHSCREDGLVRIGYAAGTRTHQRDFAVAEPALVQVLSVLPHARLVLVRGAIELEEFPALRDLSAQIEWRDFVPLDQILMEYARYSVNIVPLEIGNRYTEAKSELKFFEAALVGAPTVASPTEPYAEAIRHGETGFLASTIDDWRETLLALAREPECRRRIAEAARREVMWKYGPERRALSVRRTVARLVAEPGASAALFAAQRSDYECKYPKQMNVPKTSVLFESERLGYSRVAVIIPCYNYAHYLEEALDSVLRQTCRDIDIVAIDDCSTDNSVMVAQSWLVQHARFFNRVTLLQNEVNSKLGGTRNAAIQYAQTELFLPLDPDNLLLPNCIECCVEAIDATGAALAYPKIESFGDTAGQTWYLSDGPWQPERFRSGNYIDAMALVRTNCWAAVGGYVPFLYGWEDYEMWCRFVELGFFGVNVPHVAARYRYHPDQMSKTMTEKSKEIIDRAAAEMRARHPWTDPR